MMSLAALWAGCGNVTVDPGPGPTRGGVGGSMAAPACDLQKPFGTPAAAAAFNSDTNDDGLTFTADGLTAYISSARSGGDNYDLFKLTRTATDQPFGPATALDGGINTADQERDPHVSRDGLKLFYFSNHTLAGTFDIFVASRATAAASFGAGAALTTVNSAANDYNPFLASVDQLLYFASDRPGGPGGTDIYRVPLNVTAAPVVPTLVSEISTTASEFRPVVSDDGLTIYFDRVGTAGDDVWLATRAAAADPFSGARAVTELNGAGVDFPIWLSADGCTLYFGSDRSASGPGRNTGLHIYVAIRPR